MQCDVYFFFIHRDQQRKIENRKEKNKSVSRVQDHQNVCTPFFHKKDLKHSPMETMP